MSECIFCKFGADPNLEKNRRVADKDSYFVLLSSNPQISGHSLLIPKEHFSRLEDIPASGLGELFNEVVFCANIITQALGAKAYIIKVNNGLYKLEKKNSQHVGHIHFHIFPRYKDGEKLNENSAKISFSELKKVKDKIGKI